MLQLAGKSTNIHTVIYGAYIRCWPTLLMCVAHVQAANALTYNLLKRITARASARVHCPRAGGGCSGIQFSPALTYNLLKRITARALARVHCPRASGGCSGIQFSQALTYNLLKRTASASARVQCPRAGGGCSEARGCGSQRIHRHFECVQEPQSHVACESVGRS